MSKIFDVLVVGAGPAGMMTAIRASQNSSKVCIVDRNSDFGKKLKITGGGRCNLTSNEDISRFFDKIPRNPKFLYKAFTNFSNMDLLEFFKKNGIEFCDEKTKVYPKSNSAEDIINVLGKNLKNVHKIFGCDVKDFVGNGDIFKITTSKGELFARRIVFAGGGASFVQTGSDGYIQKLLREKGINIFPLLPSLVKIHTNADWINELAGVSLENVNLNLKNGKKTKTVSGEILFTHTGISGPAPLNMSSYITGEDLSEIDLHLDFLPDLSEEKVVEIILKKDNLSLTNKFSKFLPKNLIKKLFCEIDENRDFNNAKKDEIRAIVMLMKNKKFQITGIGGLKEAIITRGGIDVKEINPSTMELKKIKNVFVAGEIIDVDGLTGGYNLQIAFSTGFLAGQSVANSLTE